ncbi:MAG TPA: hypothetical protein VM764_09465 [Gemmatimonadaceae bacterium]|nr:hypothetical protein [Gemmatimonadaceae bacterium]
MEEPPRLLPRAERHLQLPELVQRLDLGAPVARLLGEAQVGREPAARSPRCSASSASMAAK